MLDVLMVSSACLKWNKHGTSTFLKSLIDRGLMYLMKVCWIGLTSIIVDPCVLGVNLVISVMKVTLVVAVKHIYCGDII